MIGGCVVCGAPEQVGRLCGPCAQALPECEGLLPSHVSSAIERDAATAALIDRWGFPHVVGGDRVCIGRRPDADISILNHSVSRDHAELRIARGGWVVVDLGSSNGTRIDRDRIQGLSALAGGTRVRFGAVGMYFVARPVTPIPHPVSVATARASQSGAFRYALRTERVEMCLLGSLADDEARGAGGALLCRTDPDAGWEEITLSPLEFHLLRLLCAEATAPTATDGSACIPTRRLARELPFQSRYANEENVRQVVRRLRKTLDGVGGGELIASHPRRGYYVSCPVTSD